MNYQRIIFMLFFIMLFWSFSAISQASSSASGTINVSLTIGAYVKSTIEGDVMTIMTNSPTPVVILEDGQAMPEKAVFGELLRVKMKEKSSYTIASEF